MGLDNTGLIVHCAAKNIGVDFSNMAMIGRQEMLATKSVLKRVLSNLEPSCPPKNLLNYVYAEPFFRLLGAQKIDTIDYSNYEGANIIHDMNEPISNELKNRYSMVFDGGSLEHVFNAPQAFKNCMEMIRVGGHFIQITPANNYLGHGFWQFSPELIFRMFSPENGYRIKAVILHENTENGGWWRVTDPVAMRTRVQLINDVPTYIITIAEKVSDGAFFYLAFLNRLQKVSIFSDS